MWNFGVPYKLKQLIDLVAQRNFLFTYDAKAYGPALHVEKAVAVYTRGSRFLEASAIPPSRFDHQAPYIDFWLRLIGVQDLRSIIVDNAWNHDARESDRSLVNGQAQLIELVNWSSGSWNKQWSNKRSTDFPSFSASGPVSRCNSAFVLVARQLVFDK